MIKDIVASGIGFAPGAVKFIVTRGLDIGTPPTPPTASRIVIAYGKDSRTNTVYGKDRPTTIVYGD